MKQDLRSARKHSNTHRAEILASTQCRCFQCRSAFSPSEIVEWADNDQTAICPYCGVDSVLGDASGLVLDDEFIERMHRHWFNVM